MAQGCDVSDRDNLRFCDAMDQSLTPGPNQVGVTCVELTHAETGERRFVGIACKTSSRDGGIVFNWCPFCGSDLSRWHSPEHEGAKNLCADGENQEALDSVYRERSKCIVGICRMALQLGWDACIGRHQPEDDPHWDPSWLNVVYVQTPAGQVSWHVSEEDMALFSFLPRKNVEWDGHTTEEKYDRLVALDWSSQ